MSAELVHDAHSAFVHGEGTGLADVALRILIIPICLYFNKTLSAAFFSSPSYPPFFIALFDFATFLLPVYLFFVCWSEYSWLLTMGGAILVTCATLNFLLLTPNSKWAGERLSLFNAERKFFFTEYRASLLILTIICILAIDFPLFPRYFGKTETFGLSLMDTGVGFFQIAAGLTSKQAQNNQTTKLQFIWRVLRSQSVLLLIGFARILALKATDYHEVASEYGTHWNFFFTLCFTQIAVGLMNIEPQKSGVVGLGIVALYQIGLLLGGSEYIQHAPRQTLFSQNKEGILSLFGNSALCLVGVQTGEFLFRKRKTLDEWKNATLVLLVVACAAAVGALLADQFVEPISRRMANFGFFCAMVSLNNLMLAFFVFVALIAPPSENVVVQAINFNSLLFFLMGNIFTGAVNLSINTKTTSDSAAFVILLLYLALLVAMAFVLYSKRIAIKL